MCHSGAFGANNNVVYWFILKKLLVHTWRARSFFGDFCLTFPYCMCKFMVNVYQTMCSQGCSSNSLIINWIYGSCPPKSLKRFHVWTFRARKLTLRWTFPSSSTCWILFIFKFHQSLATGWIFKMWGVNSGMSVLNGATRSIF